MSARRGSQIIRDGLILCVDAGSERSYSGSGTVFHDLSGEENHLTIVGSPDFSRDEGFTFEAVTSKYLKADPFPFPTTELTMEIWCKTSDTGQRSFVSYSDRTDHNESLLFYPDSIRLYGPSSLLYTYKSVADGKFHQVVRTSKRSNGAEILYKDGAFYYGVGYLAAGTNFTTDGILIVAQEQDSAGGGFDAAQAFVGPIAIIRIYNRVLSTAEVLHNYNATKKRFADTR
tara:strand:- start:41 stop:730 length:690 start_codon:yes stop_codon:yes gene_type:complete